MHRPKGWLLILVPLLVVLLTPVFDFVPITPDVAAHGYRGRERQVREASEAWDAAFNEQDLDRLMRLYATDAVSMPPGFFSLVGKDAIREDFEWLFDTYDSFHQTTIVDILISGNLAVEQGDYFQTFAPKDGTAGFTETGKHIVVHRKFGRSWKVVKEIWNATPTP